MHVRDVRSFGECCPRIESTCLSCPYDVFWSGWQDIGRHLASRGQSFPCVDITFRMFGCGLPVPHRELAEWATNAFDSPSQSIYKVTPTTTCNKGEKCYSMSMVGSVHRADFITVLHPCHWKGYADRIKEHAQPGTASHTTF